MSKNNTNSEKVLTFKNIIGYAIGDTGGVLAFGTIGAFLQMFYTDVLHISLASITVLMLVARIWDAINDPICGAILDSRKPTKYGRFRPYIFWFSFPLAISFVLAFVKIPGLSEGGYLVYAYITYIAFGMLYTAVNIPYGSLASVMTNDQSERSALSVARSFGAGIGSVPGRILLPLIVYSTTAAGARYLDGNKLMVGVTILAVFMLVIYFLSFKLTKENVAPPKSQESSNLFSVVKKLIKNRPFVALSAASMLLLAGDMYSMTVLNYLFKNYFEATGLYALVTVATYIPMMLLMAFMGKFVRRFGKKELCSFGAIFASLAHLILFFMHTTNPVAFLALFLLNGFGLSFFTLEVWAMVTDVIDYHEYQDGRRDEGTTYACYSFFRKLGQTVAGIGATIAMAAIGYSTAEGAIVQTDAVNIGLYNIATLVPFVIYLIMFILLQFVYPLSKARMAEIQQELARRHS